MFKFLKFPGACLAPLLLAGCLAGDGTFGFVKPVETAAVGTATTKKSRGHAKVRERRDVVRLAYRPEIGSRWSVKTEVRKSRSTDGAVIEQTTQSDKSQVIVESAVGQGYRSKSTLLDSAVTSTDKLGEILKPAAHATRGLTITYDTNKHGVPTRITNIDDVKTTARNALDASVALQPTGSASPQFDDAVRALRRRYEEATGESAISIFMNERAAATLAQGLELAVGEEQRYQTRVTAPFGGMVRATGTFKLASVDHGQGFALVEHRLVLNAADVKNALTAHLQQTVPTAQPGSAAFQQALAALKFDRSETAVYKVSLSDGAVRQMDRKIVVQSGAHQQVEEASVTVEFRWTEDKPGYGYRNGLPTGGAEAP